MTDKHGAASSPERGLSLDYGFLLAIAGDRVQCECACVRVRAAVWSLRNEWRTAHVEAFEAIPALWLSTALQ